jgi:hypothetical protein
MAGAGERLINLKTAKALGLAIPLSTVEKARPPSTGELPGDVTMDRFGEPEEMSETIV